MLDMAAHKGVEYLKGGEVISYQDMIDCAKREGVDFKPGGAILVRTGYQKKFDPAHPEGYFDQNPGLGVGTVELFEKYSAVAVGADTAYVEVYPPEDKGFVVPVHRELLWKRGTYFLEVLDLEKLSADRVYEFLLVVAPLKIEGGLGSPINPVAIC
jgi:kynurenine formamidase